MEETATVLRGDGTHAWVRTRGSTGCATCASGRGCGAGTLARMFRPRSSALRVADPLGVRPGDEVVIGVEEGMVLAAAAVAYLLPLLLLLAGTLAGSGLSGGGESGALIGGMLGLGAGLAAARAASGRLRHGAGFEARILRQADAPAAHGAPLAG